METTVGSRRRPSGRAAGRCRRQAATAASPAVPAAPRQARRRSPAFLCTITTNGEPCSGRDRRAQRMGRRWPAGPGRRRISSRSAPKTWRPSVRPPGGRSAAGVGAPVGAPRRCHRRTTSAPGPPTPPSPPRAPGPRAAPATSTLRRPTPVSFLLRYPGRRYLDAADRAHDADLLRPRAAATEQFLMPLPRRRAASAAAPPTRRRCDRLAPGLDRRDPKVVTDRSYDPLRRRSAGRSDGVRRAGAARRTVVRSRTRYRTRRQWPPRRCVPCSVSAGRR